MTNSRESPHKMFMTTTELQAGICWLQLLFVSVEEATRLLEAIDVNDKILHLKGKVLILCKYKVSGKYWASEIQKWQSDLGVSGNSSNVTYPHRQNHTLLSPRSRRMRRRLQYRLVNLQFRLSIITRLARHGLCQCGQQLRTCKDLF